MDCPRELGSAKTYSHHKLASQIGVNVASRLTDIVEVTGQYRRLRNWAGMSGCPGRASRYRFSEPLV